MFAQRLPPPVAFRCGRSSMPTFWTEALAGAPFADATTLSDLRTEVCNIVALMADAAQVVERAPVWLETRFMQHPDSFAAFAILIGSLRLLLAGRAPLSRRAAFLHTEAFDRVAVYVVRALRGGLAALALAKARRGIDLYASVVHQHVCRTERERALFCEEGVVEVPFERAGPFIGARGVAPPRRAGMLFDPRIDSPAGRPPPTQRWELKKGKLRIDCGDGVAAGTFALLLEADAAAWLSTISPPEIASEVLAGPRGARIRASVCGAETTMLLLAALRAVGCDAVPATAPSLRVAPVCPARVVADIEDAGRVLPPCVRLAMASASNPRPQPGAGHMDRSARFFVATMYKSAIGDRSSATHGRALAHAWMPSLSAAYAGRGPAVVQTDLAAVVADAAGVVGRRGAGTHSHSCATIVSKGMCFWGAVPKHRQAAILTSFYGASIPTRSIGGCVDCNALCSHLRKSAVRGRIGRPVDFVSAVRAGAGVAPPRDAPPPRLDVKENHPPSPPHPPRPSYRRGFGGVVFASLPGGAATAIAPATPPGAAPRAGGVRDAGASPGCCAVRMDP